MDQDNSKGQDKRNWRERLGIGAQGGSQGASGQGGRDLPKISDDFRKEAPPVSPRPVASARPAPRAPASAVKPAPMAPRANPKPIAAAPVSPDKLAERLRSQREASTKLAEQRVQVAKHRAEAQVAPPPPQQPAQRPQVMAAKPKFTFAEETNGASVGVAPVVPQQQPRQADQRPSAPVQQAQLAPARPPLGGPPPVQQPIFQPRTQVPPQGYAPQPNYQQQLSPSIGYQPQYNPQPVPPYRPIDPNSGYAPPPGYVPQQRGFQPPQQGQFLPPQNAPRLNVPQRNGPQLNPNFQPQTEYVPQNQTGFGAPPSRMARPQTRAPAPQPPQDSNEFEAEYDDQPLASNSRRPSTTEYQQAYREAEYGYEDEAPKSRAPLILAGLLLLALAVAGLGVWLYLSSVKPLMTGQTATDQVPAVAAPPAPAKVQAEQLVDKAAQPAVATPTKKQIYDRIVGDKEILGGELAPAVETPAAIPEPVNEAAQAAAPPVGGGEDAVPLPIPPPPPAGAGGQQGGLEPGSLVPDPNKQSAENITPAAGESQAAVVASRGIEPAVAPASDVPVPGEIADAPIETDQSVVQEKIEDAAPAPSIKKKLVSDSPKVLADKKPITRSLGAKPVVLVAPSKQAVAASKKPKLQSAGTDTTGSVAVDGGLYGATDVTTATDAAPAVSATAPKKKKTLADLFKGQDATADAQPADIAAPPAPKVAAPLAKPQSVAPAPQQQAAISGFSVQLASFRSRNEATTEFARLKAKHPGTLGLFSPIVSEAAVGGSTRYRLSVAGMSSQAQASAVCSSLFAGGERDCLVKRP
jgi:hypothetical protein